MAARAASGLVREEELVVSYDRIPPSRSAAGPVTSTHQICNLVADRNVLHFPASPLAGEPTPLGSPPKTTPVRAGFGYDP